METTDRAKTIHIIQGELHTTDEKNVILTTILGSCVSVCLHDPVSRVGGMNHFLLPGSAGSGQTNSHGVHAMELLINQLLRLGAKKDRLVARVFGGANMLGNGLSVGERNGRFAIDFLGAEGIDILGKSLGGTQARRIRFRPDIGTAQQKFAKEASVDEKLILPQSKPAVPDIELF